MTVLVYSDASYDHERDIAACGYIIKTRGKTIIQQTVYIVHGLKNISNAERWALTKGLQDTFMMRAVTRIRAYTDSLQIITTVKRKKDHDEYYDTLEMIKDDGISIVVNHVRAHANNKMNNKIDISCRAELRKYLKKHYANRAA